MKTFKVTLALLLTTLFFTHADAQIQRNSFIIGGNMNFSYSSGTVKSTGTNTQTGFSEDRSASIPTNVAFSITPTIGYFVADNFAVGLQIQYNVNSTTDTTTIAGSKTTTTTTFVTGPFARYYFGISESVFMFGEASFGFGLSAYSLNGENISQSQLNLGVGPGLAFFVNDYVALEGLIKYSYVNSTYSTFGVKNTLNQNLINFTLGIQFYFRAVEGGKK